VSLERPVPHLRKAPRHEASRGLGNVASERARRRHQVHYADADDAGQHDRHARPPEELALEAETQTSLGEPPLRAEMPAGFHAFAIT
jgi:hypothetical protein